MGMIWREARYRFCINLFNFSGLTRVNPCNPGPGFLAGSTSKSGLIKMILIDTSYKNKTKKINKKKELKCKKKTKTVNYYYNSKF
jgi:hypothetical protein